MREHVRDPAESPSAQYERILEQTVQLHRRFNEIRQQTTPSGRTNATANAADLAQHMDELTAQRAALLRQIEHLETIEDSDPRVRPQSRSEIVARDARAVLASLMTVENNTDDADVRDALARPAHTALTDTEWQDFCHARAVLARRLGYQIGIESGDSDVPLSKWLILRKNGLTFEMQHFAFPSDFAVGGTSRISFLRVTARNGDSVTRHVLYDGDWITACTDPVAQREIDRVLAVFT